MRLAVFLFALGAVLSALAANESVNVYYEGRLLTADGQARKNQKLSATARVYASENDADSLSAKSFELATDANGYFAQMISGLEVAADVSEFYVGVQVDGGAEIRPRMKVSPAPYAVVAAVAARIESEGTVGASGMTVVEGLEGSSDVTAGESFVLNAANAQVNGSVTGFGDIYIRDLVPGNEATLDFLRCNSPGNLTLDHDTLSADSSMDLTDTTGFFSTDYNQSKDMTLTAAADGVALVTYRCYKGADSSDWWVKATIRTDDITVCEDREILTGGNGWQTRTFTVPVRKGGSLYVKASQHRKLVTYDVKTYVKVAWTYVGAN